MLLATVLTVTLQIFALITPTLGQVAGELDSEELLSRSPEIYGFEIREFIAEHWMDDYSLRSDDFEDVLESRAKGSPYPVKPKKAKISAADQKARKAGVRSDQATKHVSNAIKKGNLKAAAAKLPHYKAPRNPKPGYRAKARANGKRLAKQPKTPKPQMKKGDRPTPKAQARQAAANQRTRDRRKGGQIEFAAAKAKYAATANMPNRKSTFKANGETVTGKQVRKAVFNSHHFEGNTKQSKKPAPKNFDNRLQGPANNRHRPLPKMKGTGQEFTVNKKPGGYQGGDHGTFRVITQQKAQGHINFKGVVAHDSSRAPTDPGFNDHHRVKAKNKNKPRPDGAEHSLSGTFMQR